MNRLVGKAVHTLKDEGVKSFTSKAINYVKLRTIAKDKFIIHFLFLSLPFI